MEVARPEFVPDPAASREEMETLQRRLAETARFEDDLGFDLEGIAIEDPVELDERSRFADSTPTVVGVDQAFLDDEAVSAAVAVQEGQVVEVVCGRTPLSIPYIPGLLAFREGGPIIDALQELTVEPDLLVFDGSGRIHFRQAGIATHVGVLFETPAIGVAKNLLCGRPTSSLEDPLPRGARVPILADETVEADGGRNQVEPETILGYAFQSRQFPNPETRHVNPLYVSPGHRIGPETAVDATAALCAGYKLPEPIRLADRAAGDCKD